MSDGKRVKAIEVVPDPDRSEPEDMLVGVQSWKVEGGVHGAPDLVTITVLASKVEFEGMGPS